MEGVETLRDSAPPTKGANLHRPFAAFERTLCAVAPDRVHDLFCSRPSRNPHDQCGAAGSARIFRTPLEASGVCWPAGSFACPTVTLENGPGRDPRRRLAGEFGPGAWPEWPDTPGGITPCRCCIWAPQSAGGLGSGEALRRGPRYGAPVCGPGLNHSVPRGANLARWALDLLTD